MNQSSSLVVVTVVACWVLSVATAAVDGRVYFDANGNRQADAEEPGIPLALVSDGLHVSVTDKAGRYRLDSTETAALVWVCVPLDYAASGPFWRRVANGERADFGLVKRMQGDASPLFKSPIRTWAATTWLSGSLTIS